MLEDFNDDQMVFRLEVEALEHERLAALHTSPPTATEQTEDPPREEITTTAQEELATTTGHAQVAHSEPHLVDETVSPSDIAPPTGHNGRASDRCSSRDGNPNPTPTPNSPTGPPGHYPGPREYPRHLGRGLQRGLNGQFCSLFVVLVFCKSWVRRTLSCPTGVPGVVHGTRM